ncbi:MAG: glutamine synthetase family protein [Thermaerobacter sp.]|nr:glutamine synthetase family protein [Thermaerobacter sp.]
MESSSMTGHLTLDDLKTAASRDTIDTVMVGLVDLQGRLVGKRIPVRHFLDELLPSGMHFCKYLLGTDMEMNTPDGFPSMSWSEGYGDWVAVPDLSTLRAVPWLPGTALVLSDVVDHHGHPVAVSPRQVLKRQIARAEARGFDPIMATELEFYLWRETFESAREKDYVGLKTFGWYLEDYHFLQSTKAEPFYRDVRRQMRDAGIPLVAAKGEAGPGQYEINLHHGPALAAGDHHAIYKHGLKEIAVAHDLAVTFMAKPDHRLTGSSCHIHVSLRDRQTGQNAFAGGDPDHPEAMSPVAQSFLAGQLALSQQWALLFAPTINSYKRYASASWAPVNIAWAYDNRTCGLRVVGGGQSLHVENRLPGADANPYIALAGILGAGLWGVEHRLTLPPEFSGNAYQADDLPRVPRRLDDALELFRNSQPALDTFGPEVVAHYLNAARVEREAYDAIVTTWERERYFERI